MNIFFGDLNGFLYGISELGETLVGWPKSFNHDILVSPIFSDLNNNGIFEIFSANKTGELIICDLLGNSFYSEQINTAIDIESQATISDLDFDGDLEIFFGNQNGLMVLDIKVQGENSSWNMFRGNNKRNGLLHIANENPMLGDVNIDGFINILDILIVVNFVVDIIDLTDTEYFISDVNSDNDVNVSDIILMVQIILSF